MRTAWIDRQRQRYLEAAQSGASRPGLRIAVGIAFVSLAVLAAFNGPAWAAVFYAIAGAAMLAEGIILLRLSRGSKPGRR